MLARFFQSNQQLWFWNTWFWKIKLILNNFGDELDLIFLINFNGSIIMHFASKLVKSDKCISARHFHWLHVLVDIKCVVWYCFLLANICVFISSFHCLHSTFFIPTIQTSKGLFYRLNLHIWSLPSKQHFAITWTCSVSST